MRSFGIVVAALSMLAATGCATTPIPPASPLKGWSGLDDCFRRNASVPIESAERAAATCAGSSAGDDPARTGIDRANAFFHAASAYNLLAESGTSNALCQTDGACRQMALNMIDKSISSQQDQQIRPATDGATALVDQHFILRRTLERSRALRGLAASGYAGASCGSKNSCLTQATNALGTVQFTSALTSENKETAALACALLDVRWRTHYDLGRSYEYQYVDDLRRTVQACPAYASQASDKLAEISFERAEDVRKSLASSSPPSRDVALGAVTDYRNALSVEAFKLPSYRGMGQIFHALAATDPANGVSYLASATQAYESLVREPSEAPDVHAGDLENLGKSLLDLAALTSPPGSEARRLMYQRAATAYQSAVDLQPTPQRYLGLGEALAASGQVSQSIPAYRSAMSGLSGQALSDASFALANILDQSGDPVGALQMLHQAAATASASPDIWFEIGRREFEAGKLTEARSALMPVVGRLGGAQAADAHYMLSVAEMVLRPADWVQTAFDDAEQALAIDRLNPDYLRQACLASIFRGGSSVRDGEGLQRCPDGTTPEARLLRGMYFLKQAQTLDVSAYNLATQTHWRSVLRLAEDAFQSGLDELQRTEDRGRMVRFDDLQAIVDVKDRLGQGLLVVQRCNREITLGPGDAQWAELDAFFGHYGVLKCS